MISVEPEKSWLMRYASRWNYKDREAEGYDIDYSREGQYINGIRSFVRVASKEIDPNTPNECYDCRGEDD
jgi:hypothetical protein